MLCIHNTETDPYFNLAAEEYFLRNAARDVFMLWRNAPAVIVGKNQNTNAEINREYVEDNDIAVVRRLTGGGAVFHDLGNVNFTFISLGKNRREIDFRRFTGPVIAALREMGVPADFEGRNDLVIEGRKFSGNAQHVEKDRVLHHGTLLFASKMADLSGALRVNPVKYEDRAVKSVRKRVTNISEHLPAPMDVTEFVGRLMAHVGQSSPDARMHDISPAEDAAIRELAEARYRTWDWNYGSSPKYGFSKAVRTSGGTVEVHLDVSKGAIRDARIYGDFFGVGDRAELEALLKGCRHEREELAAALSEIELGRYVKGAEPEEFLSCLF